MKKLIVYLIIGIIFIFPIKVFAVATPSYRGYFAKITNPDGAELIKYSRLDKQLLKDDKSSIPYDTELYIDYEVYYNGEYYGYDLDKEGIIKLSDLKPLIENFKLEDGIKIEPLEIYVYSNDVYLYQSPSHAYEKVSAAPIPSGTKLTINYVEYTDTPSGEFQDRALWGYVEYDNLSGWIYYKDNNRFNIKSGVAFKPENNKVLTLNEITTLSKCPAADSETISISIPKYTEITFEYKNALYDYDSKYVYVTYEGVSGWLNLYDKDKKQIAVIAENEQIALALKDIDLYTELNNLDSKTNYILKENTEFTYKYNYNNNYYISTTDGNYWIREYNFVSSPYYKSAITINDTNVYNIYKENSQIIETLPPNTKIQVLYNVFHEGVECFYISYNNTRGWLKNPSLATNDYNMNCMFITETTIFSNPNETSTKLTTIPKNTELRLQYYDKKWSYITYNNISGWAKNENIAISNFYKYGLKATGQEVEVYQNPSYESEKADFTIPANHQTISIYEYDRYWNHAWHYIAYNGKSGWVAPHEIQEVYIKYDLPDFSFELAKLPTPILKEKSKSFPLNKKLIITSTIGIVTTTLILIVFFKKIRQSTKN